jgi:hypothetical protein
LVSQGCPLDGPAVWADHWDYTSKPCCEQESETLHPRGMSESFTFQRGTRPRPCRQCVSQWRDEASYGNPRPCQPTSPPNMTVPSDFFVVRRCPKEIQAPILQVSDDNTGAIGSERHFNAKSLRLSLSRREASFDSVRIGQTNAIDRMHRLSTRNPPRDRSACN